MSTGSPINIEEATSQTRVRSPLSANVTSSESSANIDIQSRNDLQRSPQPTNVSTNNPASGVTSRRHSIFPDPRGSVIDEDDIQTQLSTPSPPVQSTQRINRNQVMPRPNYGEPPPPYPGFSRSHTAHLRLTDDIIGSQSDQTRQSMLSNTRQTGAVSANMETADIQITNIPTARSHEVYKEEMNNSLLLMILCLLLCNPLSLILTIPAVICSWKTITFIWNNNYRLAEKFRKIARILNILVILQYIIIVVTTVLFIGIYILVQRGNVRVAFNF